MKIITIIISCLFSVSVFAGNSDYSVMFYSKITITGEEKDIFIRISEIDKPAEIQIGEEVYEATLKQFMDSYLAYHGNTPYVKQKKIWVVQLKGMIDIPVAGDTDPQVIKIKHPNLPFTGIALDTEKAQKRCDNDHPFNAIAVDDNLLPATDLQAELGFRGPCFILKIQKRAGSL